MTASLRGSIGKNILKSHENAIEADVLDELVEIASGRPEGYSRDIGFRIKQIPFKYEVSLDGDYASGGPDALYELTFYGERRYTMDTAASFRSRS